MSINVRVCPGRNYRAATVIAELLATQGDFRVQQCSNCAGADAVQPDVLVMVTGLAGVEDLVQIEGSRREHPAAHLIVLSLCDDPMFSRAVLEAGADYFLLLDEAMPALAMTIRECAMPIGDASLLAAM